MKTWLILTLLLSSTLLSLAQSASFQMPQKVIWVEEFAHRDARGTITRTCTVNCSEGPDWRMESANAQADISITVCRGDKVASSITPAPSASSSPVKSIQEILDTLGTRAKFEVVDVISGAGYSRFKETGSAGYTRLIWMDRATRFPHRVSTTFADGSAREQSFRIIAVDPSTQRRLFDLGTLYPFFGQYLDQWFERLPK